MANITGITGLTLLDGAGGKIALSIKTRVLRILSDQHLSYMSATIHNQEVFHQTGTATYYVPELIQTEAYGTGNTPAQTPAAGIVSVNVDTRITAKYEIETFDISRITDATSILNQVAIGLALSLTATLNATFLKYVTDLFRTGQTLAAQKVVLQNISSEDLNKTADEMYQDWMKMEYTINTINRLYNKQMLGVPKADVMSILSPTADVGLMRAFRNQPNQLGTWQVAKTLSGKQIGNVKYIVDNMLQNKIDAGTSFSKDISYDLSKFVGLILHNEAVAFPININTLTQVINPENANLKYILKAQYGIGVLRPKLIYALTTEQNVAALK